MTVEVVLTRRRPDPVLRDLVSEATTLLGPEPAADDVIAWAADEFGDRLAVASSMSDAVVAHLVSRVLPGVDVLFADTGYHFAETIGFRDAIAATLPVTVRSLTPWQSVAEQDATFGPRLHERAPDLCCQLRKTGPVDDAVGGYEAWATGLRRVDAPGRAGVPVVSWDSRRRVVKLNPIAGWADAQVDAYAAEHGLLENPLRQLNYRSIGCAPCTRPVGDGEDGRSGRWPGHAKVECGLHTDGDGI